MIGKELKITTNQLTYGEDDQNIKAYACFKYKSNHYILFKKPNDANLSYGSSHIDKDKAVIIDLKHQEDELFISLIDLIINKQELKEYEIISLDKVSKCEIIGSNSLEVPLDKITLLEDLTIPKKVVFQEKTVKKSKVKPIIISLFLLILIGASFFLYYNRQLIFGKPKTLLCVIAKETDLNASVDEHIYFTFTYSQKIDYANVVTSYVFKDEQSYTNFKNMGLYYKYMKQGDTYNLEDENLTYKTFSNLDISSIKGYDYIEVMNLYLKKEYICEEGT